MSLPPFQHLVDEHWRDVARLAHALAPGHGDDVAQQAWTQALAAYPRLTHARNLRSWLLTITHRCAMDHHRAARRTTPHEDPSLLAQAPDARPRPRRPTATCGRGSPPCRPRQRDAVVLRFVGDLDHRAVAAALGTSPGMSRRLVSDAIATLRLDLRGPAMTNPFTTFDPPARRARPCSRRPTSRTCSRTPRSGGCSLAVRADGARRDVRLRAGHGSRGPLAHRASPPRVSPRVLRHAAPTDAARRALAAYLAGAARSVDVRTDLALASAFQREVLTGLAARVGYGERTTYAVLASAVEHPGAARAVGTRPRREPAVHRAALPPGAARLGRGRRVCRWAGRQGAPPGARGGPRRLTGQAPRRSSRSMSSSVIGRRNRTSHAFSANPIPQPPMIQAGQK